jgi:hypothetical protein
MSKTTIEKRCDILSDFWGANGENEKYLNLVNHYRLGFAASFLTKAGATTLTEFGEMCVDQTWDSFLTTLRIEDQGYEDLTDLYSKNNIEG